MREAPQAPPAPQARPPVAACRRAIYIIAGLLSFRGNSTGGRWGLATIVALVLIALSLPASASAANGAISGKVTEAAGGAPVVDAGVCAEEQGGEFEFECTLTELGGSYEITGLPPGKYVVGFSAGESGRNLARQYYDGVSSWFEADEVTVPSSGKAEEIDAALGEGAVIEGKVTAAGGGTPIGNVEVCAWREEGEEFDGCAYTAINGAYEIAGLRPGPHEVEFWDYEHGYEPLFLNSISVSTGHTTMVDAAMFLGGRISGHVYAASNHQAIGGVAVCAIWVATGESRGCAHTSNSGAYEFFPVSAGAWKIAFSPEPTEFEFFEEEEVGVDGWPTQFWNLKPTLASADVIDVTHGSAFTGIDALLGPGPPSPLTTSSSPQSTTPAPVAVTSKPAPKVLCRKGFQRKRVEGTLRCVKRHKLRHHRRHRHR